MPVTTTPEAMLALYDTTSSPVYDFQLYGLNKQYADGAVLTIRLLANGYTLQRGTQEPRSQQIHSK